MAPLVTGLMVLLRHISLSLPVSSNQFSFTFLEMALRRVWHRQEKEPEESARTDAINQRRSSSVNGIISPVDKSKLSEKRILCPYSFMHIYIYLTLISEEVIQRMGGTNIEESGERSSNTHRRERGRGKKMNEAGNSSIFTEPLKNKKTKRKWEQEVACFIFPCQFSWREMLQGTVIRPLRRQRTAAKIFLSEDKE